MNSRLTVAVIAACAHLGASIRAEAQQRREQRTEVRDSTPADSVRRGDGRRLAVTADLRRTAFADDETRALFARARSARLVQDSSLTSYAATGRERTTVGAGIGDRGLEHTVFRRESVFDVQWQAGVGARVQLTGARVGIPLATAGEERQALEGSLTDAGVSPVPYYPGAEPLSLSGTVRPDVDDVRRIEPLAIGAEAYYTYSTGDSIALTLPDGRAVHLRELRVRPRRPEWNVVVGSFWFDTRSGQLVRAAYRYAAPQDVLVSIDQRARAGAAASAATNPLLARLAKAIVSPVRVDVSGIAIEYGLFEGQYWLPVVRSIEGTGRVSLARLSVVIEQRFSYRSVNRPVTIPTVVLNDPASNRPEIPDSLTGAAEQRWRDSVRTLRRRARVAFADSLHAAPCDSTGARVIGRRRGRDSTDVAVAVVYPCDIDALAQSPDFTTPLFAADESRFGKAERDAMLAGALPFGAQALLALGALPRPSFQYGLSMTRYNRIEGLSTGVLAEQQFGAGYVGSVTGRIGWADREPSVELSGARTSGAARIALTAYNRLAAANDWGDPLSVGASAAALLFGRDEGFYYRASGADLRWMTSRVAPLEWRLFGEQQRTATPHADASLGGEFVPNIVARRTGVAGVGVHWLHVTGIDPRGVRTITDVRVEAATGRGSYGRSAFDATVSTGLPRNLAAAITLSGGTSAGALPPQRRWFLGGTRTIRGQSPDTAQSGNAFWMSHAEIGMDRGGYRLTTFGDLGWVGSRAAWTTAVRPLSGAGVGLSVLNGLLRVDLARGFYPRRQTQLLFYLDARF